MAAPFFEYDCDTASGVFSELKQAGTASHPVAVKGTVTTRIFRVDPRWLPAVAISVKSKTNDMVMIRIAALKRDKGPLSLQLLTTENGKETEQELGTVSIDQTIPFAILPSAKGLTIMLANITREVPFDKSSASATSVSCSTGQFFFGELSFGD